jgi:hypothetical protein
MGNQYPHFNKQAMKSETVKLAEKIIKVLKVKALRGCNNPSWSDYQNGLGEDVGDDIQALITEAEAIVKAHEIKENP